MKTIMLIVTLAMAASVVADDQINKLNPDIKQYITCKASEDSTQVFAIINTTGPNNKFLVLNQDGKIGFYNRLNHSNENFMFLKASETPIQDLGFYGFEISYDKLGSTWEPNTFNLFGHRKIGKQFLGYCRIRN